MNASDLEDMFTLIGDVRSARVVCDAESAISLGRGFVEMSTRVEAENGVLHFNGQNMNGQTLMVRLNEVTAREPIKKSGRRHSLKGAKR
jgi:RNA recognition motif-containing protein